MSESGQCVCRPARRILTPLTFVSSDAIGRLKRVSSQRECRFVWPFIRHWRLSSLATVPKGPSITFYVRFVSVPCRAGQQQEGEAT